MPTQSAQGDQGDEFDLATLILKTLSHPDRLQILRCLGRYGRLNGMAFHQHLSVSQSTLSHHLTKMTDRGILIRQRKGKEIYYSLSDPKLIRILETLGLY